MVAKGPAPTRGKWRRPRVSTFQAIRDVAARFCPPYALDKEDPAALRVILRDPSGVRPNLVLGHHYVRRLFLKTSYLRAASTVPGRGPDSSAELVFRFRGPLSRQRVSVDWAEPVPDGDRWLEPLRRPLLQAVHHVDALQSLRIRWSPKRRVWLLELETMSGSVVSGLGAFLPVAVPFDPSEARAVIKMIDILRSTA
jgi:hypothetical protein